MLLQNKFVKKFVFGYYIFLVIAVICIGYRIFLEMIFIGDQAWFYLSARDMLLGKDFPLVGITSSHTWLHQGALWTYLLSIALWIGRFNPISGVYLSFVINVLTILLIYLLGKRMFSKKTALIAASLYAFSPLVLDLAKMPYHTTPIPLLTLIYFYFLTKWLNGNKKYLSFSVMMLAVLYNFELATVILAAPLLLVGFYGLAKKKEYITKLRTNDLTKTLLFGVVPMIPVILYDFTHGFSQTLVYAVWLLYRPFSSVFLYHSSQGSFSEVISFLLRNSGNLIFLPNALLGVIIIVASSIWVTYYALMKKHGNAADSLLILWIVIAICSIIANKTPSDAYLPMLFIALFFIIGRAVDYLPDIVSKLAIAALVVTTFLNLGLYIKHNNFGPSRDLSLKDIENAVLDIHNKAKGRPFKLVGKGPGSQFRSFTMPYEYLAWYHGYRVDQNAKLIFVIEEKGNQVLVTKK